MKSLFDRLGRRATGRDPGLQLRVGSRFEPAPGEAGSGWDFATDVPDRDDAAPALLQAAPAQRPMPASPFDDPPPVPPASPPELAGPPPVAPPAPPGTPPDLAQTQTPTPRALRRPDTSAQPAPASPFSADAPTAPVPPAPGLGSRNAPVPVAAVVPGPPPPVPPAPPLSAPPPASVVPATPSRADGRRAPATSSDLPPVPKSAARVVPGEGGHAHDIVPLPDLSDPFAAPHEVASGPAPLDAPRAPEAETRMDTGTDAAWQDLALSVPPPPPEMPPARPDRTENAADLPPIEIHIGRLEIKAAPPPSPPPSPPAQAPRPGVKPRSLDAYLGAPGPRRRP